MKMYPKVERPKVSLSHRCKINLFNHKGDECIATFDPDVAETVEVAETALADFFDRCIKEYGSHAPAFGRKPGEVDYDILRPGDLSQVEDVVIHAPLSGG